ncbi:hypothetical protein LPJ61_001337 [Coemansia biformis]|uniref:Amino acid transporter transmembrane domain-containing protein n=1 Tax=Coemansia biformis TaxID=1286918 RepID=A0A9W7YGL8_9FUNG|nr:hypothetical protein LPJ61_001337 [Coemansia biformis]
MSQPLLADRSARGRSYGSTATDDGHRDCSPAASAAAGQSSAADTFFHIVCITAGTGILQLPYALHSGGWVGVLYIVLAAAISVYSGRILVRCLYHRHGVRLQSYSEVAEAAFGPRGRITARVLKDVGLLGVVGTYIVLAGISIDSLVAGTAGEQLGPRFWIAASAAAVWAAIVLARAVHDVLLLSIFGTLTTVVMVVIVIGLGVGDLAQRRALPPTKLADMWMAPISLASICFSFGGNLNWPDLEASMKSPKQWDRTLTLATAFIAAVYLCVAAVGYGVYGDEVQSPILLSLPPGVAVATAKAMVTAHVLLACPILLTTVFNEAERDMGIGPAAGGSTWALLGRTAFRSTAVAAVAAAALFVPDFSKVVPILGAITSSLVVFVIPVACYVRLFRGQHSFSVWEYAWCVLIVCVGLGCLVIGTSQALADLGQPSG